MKRGEPSPLVFLLVSVNFHLSSRNSLPLNKEVFLKLHDDMHAGTAACTLVQSMIGLKDLMIGMGACRCGYLSCRGTRTTDNTLKRLSRNTQTPRQSTSCQTSHCMPGEPDHLESVHADSL